MSSPAQFGATPEGQTAWLYRLQNQQLRVQITNFGARMVSIEWLGASARAEHLLLGFDSVAGYNGGSFGAVLGRVANRIAGGRFAIDGRSYELSRNEGNNTLHGGPEGFAHRLWITEHASDEQLKLRLHSDDGDQGFPGALDVWAHYRLEAATLSLELSAQTDLPTAVNLSAHPYFNLGGVDAIDALDHEITIAADSYLPTDAQQIPTGAIAAVASTPLDFRVPTPIGRHIRTPHPQLLHAQGFDHYFIGPAQQRGSLHWAARVRHPASGRQLDILSTQPGLQFYSGNKLNGSIVGRGGSYRQSAGLAFEPQGFPNAPNEPAFPSTILRPGSLYREVIQFHFSVAAAAS